MTLASQLVLRKSVIEQSEDLRALVEYMRQGLRRDRAHEHGVPSDKALLSRDGGVCPRDGSRLEFDPFDRERHGCNACGASYGGERHYRAWVWRYQLWLSERVLQAALLAALTEESCDEWATMMLEQYCVRYRSYPNVDNVLGPTRPFFSTYLESIWLTQICIAALFLEAGTKALSASVRDSLKELVDESSTIIASFVEGRSNRQVWNSTALIAAGLFLRDERRWRVGLESPYGIRALIEKHVSAEGRWHEGENYHLFALRGFLLAAELVRLEGDDLYDEFPQLGAMYQAPLDTLLPDLTIPARGDSPYGVSVRQHRFAELWEIGYARTKHERILGVLVDLYGPEGREAGNIANEIAEVEQNRAPCRLARTVLGWKACMWMVDRLPSGEPSSPPDLAFVDRPKGPIVLRPDRDRYVSLECGGTGGGHGHPDRLHLTVWDAGAVQMDFGTGSYVTPSLHFYRSWLCHSGPVRRGTDGREGAIVAAGGDRQNRWSWCQATVAGFAGSGSSATRSVVVGRDFIVDVVDVDVDDEVVIDLPVRLLGLRTTGFELGARIEPWFDIGYDGLELHDVSRTPDVWSGDGDHVLILPPRDGESITLVTAPGVPTLALGRSEDHSFPVRSCRGAGRWVQIFAKANVVLSVHVDRDTVFVAYHEGEWSICVRDRSATVVGSTATSRLSGVEDIVVKEDPAAVPVRQEIAWPLLVNAPSDDTLEDLFREYGISMSEESYRRSEAPYPGQEAFSARCLLYAVARRLHVIIDVTKPRIWFRPLDWPDPMLDNEEADINSDSVQLYLQLPTSCRGDDERGSASRWMGHLIRPFEMQDHTPRIRAIRGTEARGDEVAARVSITKTGYRVSAVVECSRAWSQGSSFLFNVVVNEMYAERLRRAGQLSLSGGGWVYLRGDREAPWGALAGILS